MRSFVGWAKAEPAPTEPQSRTCARAPCPRVRPVFTLSTGTWARRHARAFVTSALRAGAFAHPTNDRIRRKPSRSDRGFAFQHQAVEVAALGHVIVGIGLMHDA